MSCLKIKQELSKLNQIVDRLSIMTKKHNNDMNGEKTREKGKIKLCTDVYAYCVSVEKEREGRKEVEELFITTERSKRFMSLNSIYYMLYIDNTAVKVFTYNLMYTL